MSANAFKITPAEVITEIIGATGDGAGNGLDGPFAIAMDAAGNTYVTGGGRVNAFKIAPPEPNPALSDFGMVVLLLLMVVAGVIVIRNRSKVYRQ